MNDQKNITIALTDDEALILFELVQIMDQRVSLDAAEKTVLWSVEGQLEKQITATFSDNYTELLANARKKLLA